MSPEHEPTPLALAGELNPADFGVWLLHELAASGLSQRQLAERSGLHHSTVSRLLRAKREPSYATVLKLAGGLGLLETGGGGQRLTPMARVERALRSDASLRRGDVIRVMQVYASVRRTSNGSQQAVWRREARYVAAQRAESSNLRIVADGRSRGPHVRHADLALAGQRSDGGGPA